MRKQLLTLTMALVMLLTLVLTPAAMAEEQITLTFWHI